MSNLTTPVAVKISFVFVAPKKAPTKPEVASVVSEVSRAVNFWLYS